MIVCQRQDHRAARLIAFGRETGVRLLIENNVVAPFNAPDGINRTFLMAEADEMVTFAKSIESPWFAYLIDLGHLNVSARTLGYDREAFLEVVAPWVGGYHISDNDGLADSNQPFGDDVWFLPWLKAGKEPFHVLEIYNVTRDEHDRAFRAVASAVGA